MASVQAKSLGLRFPGGQVALQAVDFAVRSGEFVAIVGPSGCGKSTLLRLIAGLHTATTGHLTVASPGSPNARHRVAFVFQDARLLPWRTVADNIRLPLELARVDTTRQATLIHSRLQLIGLTAEDARKRPHMLSGGMKMRVSLARALVTEPDLLLLDEPFAALDDLLRQQLNEDLLRIWQEQGWTGLFVTHNVAEAVYLSQRVLVMGRSPGTLVAEIAVPFPYPRSAELREVPEFVQRCGQVSRALRQAVLSRESSRRSSGPQD
jgi:NitT/TauT family transport system ATP-binding protein